MSDISWKVLIRISLYQNREFFLFGIVTYAFMNIPTNFAAHFENLELLIQLS